MIYVSASTRQPIRIGQEIGAGGEGRVYEALGLSGSVVKIYGSEPLPQKIAKLRSMVGLASPEITSIAAWPIELVVDSSDRVHGIVMPRVVGRRDVHELYSPKSRAEAFPEADFRFLVHVSTNIARAFSVIHSNHIAIGDVNHGNLLVGPDGTVKLIDCDSFQISHNGRVLTCDVGSPLFTPPELQGQPLRGIVRTAQHDAFGLAVLLFHMLFLGRHPFAGRYLGSGDMSPERAIKEFRFAYSPSRVAFQMEPPPGMVSLESFGAEVARLFVRAFDRSGVASGRPDAATWVSALEKLKLDLRACSTIPWHFYPGHLGKCIWCDVEGATRLFGMRYTTEQSTVGEGVESLWKAVLAVPAPKSSPALPSDGEWRPPFGIELPSTLLRTVRRATSLVLMFGSVAACSLASGPGSALVGLFVGWLIWPRVSRERRAEVESRLSNARTRWETLLKTWEREALNVRFDSAVNELRAVRERLESLPEEREKRFRKLQRESRKRQMDRFLDRFRIDRSRIAQIGPSRTAMLAAYGIETAADVTLASVINVPGFGSLLANQLIEWKRDHEKNFRFDPNERVSVRDCQELDREIGRIRGQLLTDLARGPARLRAVSIEIENARDRLIPPLNLAWTELKVAEAVRDAL